MREEAMPYTYNDLRDQYRCTHDGDAWGNCMGWRFAVAAEMWHRGLAIPSEWGYSPGMASDPRELETLEGETCADATDEALELFGAVLLRVYDKLKAAGEDY
jgi:hypothetical protein